MDNSRTLIRSSIVSLVIVTFGLFLLCMSRAPRINSDNSAFQGGGATSATANGEEQDLLNLLNEAGDEMSLGDENNLLATEDNTNGNDAAIISLLNEGNDNIVTKQPAQSEEESMDELVNLLGNDEETKYSEVQNLEQPKELVVPEQGENDVQKTGSSIQNATGISELKDKITKLEQVLADRTNEKEKLEITKLEQILSERAKEKENLQMELQRYDLQIAELKNQSSSSGSFNHSITPAAYSETNNYNAQAGDRQAMNSFNADAAGNFDIAYESALQLFQSHHYTRAASRFYELLQLNRKHSLSDNCQYWIGECYFAQGKYYQSIAEFIKVAAYDAGDKKDDAQMMLGLAFMKLGEVKNAQSELDWLVSAFAYSEYVPKAYRYLKRF